ncbi:MAG: RecX family transcriptional regulator [Clostridia bacterium]|nr:RecX family transcriptional regulator [Clostridia bacterium]
MGNKVLSVRTKEKKTPLVVIDLLVGEEHKKYTVSEGTYREIGCPLSGEEIDASSLDAIAREDEERRALAKALRLLSYTDNSERQLKQKLIMASFSKFSAEAAVKECVRLGYINEERQLERLVLSYATSLFGPRKIMAKLIARSYSTEQIIKAITSLEDDGKIDFKKSKEALIRTKLPENADYQEKRKLLYKYGYSK